MRKLLAALLCLLLIAPAYAQKTKTQLDTEVNTNLPDNAVGAITPADVRNTLTDMIASWVDLNGTISFNCSSNQFVNGFTSLSAPLCTQPTFANLGGNISVNQMNGGTGASAGTYWRGDGKWVAATGCISVLAFGGVGDGVTDNTLAITNALAALPALGGCLYFPTGIYKVNSAISYTLTAVNAGLTIKGDGVDITELRWGAGVDGLTVNFSQYASNSIHFSDFTMSTVDAGTHNGIHLVYTGVTVVNGAEGLAYSDITNLTFRGSPIYQTNPGVWGNAIRVDGVSFVNFINVNAIGNTQTGGHNSNGVYLRGLPSASPGPFFGVVYNFVNTNFQNLFNGVAVDTYIQGVAISNSNFTSDTFGVAILSGAIGIAQVTISNSQFGYCLTNNISDAAGVDALIISNNLISSAPSTNSIALQHTNQFTITGNSFNGETTFTSNGIQVISYAGFSGVITGNSFYNFSNAIWLQPSSKFSNVQSNTYSGNSANVFNQGAGNLVGGGSP